MQPIKVFPVTYNMQNHGSTKIYFAVFVSEIVCIVTINASVVMNINISKGDWWLTEIPLTII